MKNEILKKLTTIISHRKKIMKSKTQLIKQLNLYCILVNENQNLLLILLPKNLKNE